MLGEQRYLDAAERTVRAALHTLERYPDAHATLLRALEELLAPPKLVVLRGTPERARAVAAQARASLRAAPARIRDSERREAPGLLAQRAPRETAVAYVCEGMTCRAPVELTGNVTL